MAILRLILGDQLSESISSLQGCNKAHDVILMGEVMAEATYVKHHQKKIAFLFAAMRHFAADLQEKGYQLDYHKLDDKEEYQSFTALVQAALERHDIEKIIVTYPGEYRVLQEIKGWKEQFDQPVEIRGDDRFLCSISEFSEWADDRQNPRMEYFYRMMRRQHDVLMDGEDPIGGQWNYDADNRKPPKQSLDIPPPYQVKADAMTRDVLSLVGARFADHFGELEPFDFAITRQQALAALDDFINKRLPHFGDYQDAMLTDEPWMYHAHLSFYLNCGLLLPMECIRAAEEAYHTGKAPLNAVEGFIRQILGWREYVRGIYCLEMPDYAEQNFLEAQRDLPDFYWTAETDMNCLRQCVTVTKKHAYAHHIQRLMVLGNFALLTGIDPAQVNEWFLIVYADAYEWVELPNVSGMILYADGGYLASKPYAAGGNYIHKMSDYCKDCRYKVTKKNGPDACPFNYLYWDFLARHRDKLADNHRLGMIYKTYDRMSAAKKETIQQDAQAFLAHLP